MTTWPDGFLWGTGASSTQCEGAAPESNWIDWEADGHAPPSGDGNGFARRYAEDFALYAGLGLTHHRLSMEWARLEPAPGVGGWQPVNDTNYYARAANHEWLHGFDVSFGIIDADRNVRPSAQVLAAAALGS